MASVCTLSPVILSALRIGKLFEDIGGGQTGFPLTTPFSGGGSNAPLVSGLEYHESGAYLLAASEPADAFFIFDALTLPELRSVHRVTRTGFKITRFAHNPATLLYTTVRLEDHIKVLSLGENKIIHSLGGHKRRISSMEQSPLDDVIISGAIDDSVMLWDIRTPGMPVASIPLLKGAPLVNFDPQGLVFGVAITENPSITVRLYDARAYERGPFSTWEHVPSSAISCSRLSFSNDGNYILLSGKIYYLLSVGGGGHFSISAWDGSLRASYIAPVPIPGAQTVAKISPDSQYIYAPIGDKRVAFWESSTGKGIALIDTPHQAPVSSVAFNPKFASMATACSSVAFWTL